MLLALVDEETGHAEAGRMQHLTVLVCRHARAMAGLSDMGISR